MKVLLPLLLIPSIAIGSDILLANNSIKIPNDFRNYFYNSEVMVQVYLNDLPLFDGSFLLNEDGEISLIQIFDEENSFDQAVKDEWKIALTKGISLGECNKNCPNGLMSADYRLDTSALKLYTSKYEIQKTNNAYISLPQTVSNGVIMHNNVSAVSTGDSHAWNLNSSVVSSLLGWTQKVSFQTYSSSQRNQSQETNFYELYTQKELQGDFFRFGLFSPDSDKGSVETNGFSTGSVTGVMWGTSNTLLVNEESVSASPIYVTAANPAVAEIWRDGKLIYSQQLQSGVQALDTRRLPSGIYDITINILENGKIVDTQLSQIYKPLGWRNPTQKWRVNVWGGIKQDLTFGDHKKQDNDSSIMGGGAVDYLLTPRVVLGSSIQKTKLENQISARTDINISPNNNFYGQYIIRDGERQKNQSIDLRYYRNLFAGGSMSSFWRHTSNDSNNQFRSDRYVGNTWGTSLYTKLPWSSSLTLNGQYTKSSSREGFGIDAAINKNTTLADRNVSFRLSAYDRPGFNQEKREQGITIGVSFSLAPRESQILSMNIGMNDKNNYSSLDYQWKPQDNNNFKWLGAGVSENAGRVSINGNGAIETRSLSSDFYTQHNIQEHSTTSGINLSQTLAFGGGKIAIDSGSNGVGMDSALIVDLESDNSDLNIMASDSLTETKLYPGRNVIPSALWKKETIQFYSAGNSNAKVFPESEYVQMNRGSVKYLKLKAVKATVLIGMLQDSNGKILKHLQVDSDIARGVINADGVLTLEMGENNKVLTVLDKDLLPTLSCSIPKENSNNNGVQFYSAIQCLPIGGI
ncbi:TcfC E-set like domain-containing protein [Providencia alcalifaciens]|uniref:TcfC E-set like domain-containing protein n=1 Tax=Providencia alcalifaciens TaxID=126385 RepID=UPI00044A1FF6|nr:TcfC E-set like domain-containing protein [Providencia alcalifaciens]EUD06298.1 hypothetical protein HMPREF1564_3773 [Providencia alcalifaciens R90-1475]